MSVCSQGNGSEIAGSSCDVIDMLCRRPCLFRSHSIISRTFTRHCLISVLSAENQLLRNNLSSGDSCMQLHLTPMCNTIEENELDKFVQLQFANSWSTVYYFHFHYLLNIFY